MKKFVKVNLTKTNIAYFVADTVKRAVEIDTAQNGAETKKTIITFDDGATLTCIDSAQKVIESIEDATQTKQNDKQSSPEQVSFDTKPKSSPKR